MSIPSWALAHKQKNTDVREVRGNYYLYSTTSKWCPEKKRTKKVTLAYLGTISEAHGFRPAGSSPRGRPRKPKPAEASFNDTFEKIEDPRCDRKKMYSVSEIFLVALCAIICGANGWKDMEDYGKAKCAYLRQFFDFTHGTPSDDTFRRFFRAIDPSSFQNLFREWVGTLAKKVDASVIAIDGKASRHSFDGDEKMLHMVNAFASDARIVLGQEKVSEKSNEITAIPKLLEWLDIKGSTVTIDAMGCQYKIAEQIVDKKGEYIFSLKGNQSGLVEEVQSYFTSPRIKKDNTATDHDKGHGRIETRKCTVISEISGLKSRCPQWKTLQSIVQIESTRQIRDKVTVETRYYVSSSTLEASDMLKKIRSHWGIENSLHWILDMSFGEDASRIRKENAPQNMAILRQIALNLMQNAKQERQSLEAMRRVCGWDNGALDNVILKPPS